MRCRIWELARARSCGSFLRLKASKVMLQGAELNVLSSAVPVALQKVSWIAIRGASGALYEGGARLRELDAVLRSVFRMTGIAAAAEM